MSKIEEKFSWECGGKKWKLVKSVTIPAGTKFYLVSRENAFDARARDTVEIRTEPCRTYSGEIRVHGWVGGWDNWNITAHGEFSSLKEARAAKNAKFGKLRRVGDDDRFFVGSHHWFECYILA